MSFTSKTRWRQFSLRGLLVLVTVSAALFGWFAWRLQKARVENEAAEAIVHAGGEVAYADQFHGGVSRLTPLPPRTRWIGGLLERTFGADPHRRLVSVKLYDDDSVALVSQYALRDLEVVRLDGGSSITDEALPHLRGCNQLRVLYLERSDITDRALEHIDEFTRLEELWLCNTPVSDAVLEKIARLPRLSVLDIRGTNISDDGLKMVASMPAIGLLYLDGSSFTDAGLKNLRASPSLTSLWLGEQSSASLDLGILTDFPKLDSLTLTGSLVTDDRLKALANNRRIERLKLQGCTRLTDESLSIVAAMPNLRTAGISSSPFSAKAVNEFKIKKPNCTVW